VVEVRKRNNESIESLIRRFQKRVQQSGVLVEARRVRFYERPKSKQRKRTEAQRRAELRELREKLEKMGLLEQPRR
jgi:small subunit ribosomal protein S21